MNHELATLPLTTAVSLNVRTGQLTYAISVVSPDRKWAETVSGSPFFRVEAGMITIDTDFMDLPCLLCHGRGKPCDKVEHALPRSLGNELFVLPKGVVCDDCNEKMGRLQALFNVHSEVALPKAFYLEKAKGKKTRFPAEVNWVRGHIDGHTGKIGVTHKDGIPTIMFISDEDEVLEFSGNSFKLGFEVNRSRTVRQALSRVVHQIAFECLAFVLLPFAQSDRFHDVARYIRFAKKGERKRYDYTLVPQGNALRLRYYVTESFVYAEVNLFGVQYRCMLNGDDSLLDWLSERFPATQEAPTI